MGSAALAEYTSAASGARTLCATATDARLRPLSLQVKQQYLHASLAAHVAAWDNYIKSAIREYYRRTANPLDVRYAVLHNTVQMLSASALRKLNTPNRDNARNAIVECVGYDPLPDWTWKSANLTATDIKDFMDEVFKVRHSFAHGFGLPALDWLAPKSGANRLTVSAVNRVDHLFSHLTLRTDKGLAKYATLAGAPSPIW